MIFEIIPDFQNPNIFNCSTGARAASLAERRAPTVITDMATYGNLTASHPLETHAEMERCISCNVLVEAEGFPSMDVYG